MERISTEWPNISNEATEQELTMEAQCPCHPQVCSTYSIIRASSYVPHVLPKVVAL